MTQHIEITDPWFLQYGVIGWRVEEDAATGGWRAYMAWDDYETVEIHASTYERLLELVGHYVRRP